MSRAHAPQARVAAARAPAEFTRLFNPRAIAVVGATGDPRRIGGQPVDILVSNGFQGAVHPVNPRYEELGGRRCYPDVTTVPAPCDLALVAVAAPLVPRVIEQCGAAGIPFAIVFSAGFREIGEEGARLEAELKAAIAKSGVRVIGPNCIGTMNLKDRVLCGFGPGFRNPGLKAGPVAMVSQSGGFAYSVAGLAANEGLGFNYIVSVGNEADVSTLDLMAEFLERGEVEVVVSYIEGIADGRKLRAIGARALELGKPIVVWKVGNSPVGRKAAESHTASMTADYALYRAAFREGGFVEITDVHDMVDVVRVFGAKRLPRGPGVAVITTSGGSGVLIADCCDRQGLRLPPLEAATVEAISPLAPKYSSFANPIDLTAQVGSESENFNRITDLVAGDPNIDQVIIRYGAAQAAGSERWAAGLVEIARKTDKPLLVAWSRVPDPDAASLQTLEKHRVPWLLTPPRTATAAAALYEFSRKRETRATCQARGAPHGTGRQPLNLPAQGGALGEHRSKRCLAAYGIATVREAALTLEEVERLSTAPFPFPLVVKIDSPDIAHKTEAGGVRVGIASVAELKQAAAEIAAAARRHRPDARIEGVLVAEMARGVEVIAGAVNDRYFGPVVMFGLGGVFTEVLRDVTYRFAPFDMTSAREMIAEIKAAPLLTGYRGRPAIAVDALAEVLSRLSLLIADHGERIAEIDVNPIFVDETSALAADALLVLKPAAYD